MQVIKNVLRFALPCRGESLLPNLRVPANLV
jgi:hypothetical protein